jgi:hypothetical protein
VGARQGAPQAASNTVSTAASRTNAAAIPLAEVAAEAEAAFASLHSIEDNLSADQATATIQQGLSVLTRDTGVRLEESSRMLVSSPSLETLRRLDREWEGFREGRALTSLPPTGFAVNRAAHSRRRLT